MSIYNLVDKNILLPLGDLVYGSSVSKELRRLKYNDFLSREELQKIQNSKLHKLVEHCYNTVPYYRKLFDTQGITPDDIQTSKDIEKIPILTKQLIRDNYDDLFSTSISPKRWKKSTTGGSTGRPLTYVKDKQTWSADWATNFRAWNWYGIELGDRFFTFGGNSIVGKRKRLGQKELYDRFILNTVKEDCTDLGDSAMAFHYQKMIKSKPKFIRGYPSALNYLAIYIIKNELDVPNLKAVITTGEILLPQYRANIKKAFKTDVFDTYGAADGGIAAHECTVHNGLHIHEERCIIEVVDSNGQSVENGNIGYVVSTDLYNYAMPFLRYKVGDLSSIKKEMCLCGRSSRLISHIEGRTAKLLHTKSGVPFSTTIIDNLMFKNMDYHNIDNQIVYNKIKKYQVVQNENGDIVVCIVPNDKEESITTFDYVIENFSQNFPGSIIQIKFVDDIQPLASGKEDYCVSHFMKRRL